MNINKKLTAFCGLYCLDCIPANKELFEKIEQLEKVLDDLNVGEYVKVRAEVDAKFNKYEDFREFLALLKTLKCKGPCREGGGKEACEIRDCVQAKWYEGCWECKNTKTCRLLERLKIVHPNLEENYELIRREGIEKWSIFRKGHYYWQNEKEKEK